MKELICIVCPKGCHLHVDEQNNFAVTGNGCPRGAVYGKTEISDPQRVLTTTVKIRGAACRRCPVKTNRSIPKKAVFSVMESLNSIELTAPVHIGEIVIENVCGSGADIVVTRNL
ncbi:MAG: DUF1667 domain-containing protein [Clostridia bacterium]